MQKHPHLRGENLTKRRLSVEHLETSPPTWGKPSVNVEQVLIGGNIPTYVGKTWDEANGRVRIPKHPHLRGENQG